MSCHFLVFLYFWLLYIHFSYADATKKKCLWAHRIFSEWKIVRNARNALDPNYKRIGSVMEMTQEELVDALCPFILEVRKQTGENYPAQTLYEIIVCIQLYMNMYGREWKVIDDPAFRRVKNTLDNRMKELVKLGFIAPRVQAQEIDIQCEDKLWEDGVLGDSNPKQLVHTLLYMLGIQFGLRAGQEHRDLRVGPKSQFALYTDTALGKEYLEYREDSSKNNQGGIQQRKVSRKVVRAYENVQNPNRCLVCLYKKYLELRPKTPRCPDHFYLRPLNKPTADCWYSHQAIGRQTLSKVVSSLLEQVGVKLGSGRLSNHSLRATCASRLFQNNVDEQLIMDRTGHRSASVRSYKRTSNIQLNDLSEILYGNTANKSAAVPPKRPKVEQSVVSTPQVAVGNESQDVHENVVVNNVTSGHAKDQVSFNFTINLNK